MSWSDEDAVKDLLEPPSEESLKAADATLTEEQQQAMAAALSQPPGADPTPEMLEQLARRFAESAMANGAAEASQAAEALWRRSSIRNYLYTYFGKRAAQLDGVLEGLVSPARLIALETDLYGCAEWLKAEGLVRTACAEAAANAADSEAEA